MGKILKKKDYDDYFDRGIVQYKKYKIDSDISVVKKHIKENSGNNIVRSSVISADRVISSLSREEVKNCISKIKI